MEALVGFVDRMAGPVLFDVGTPEETQSFLQEGQRSGQVVFLLANGSEESKMLLERSARKHLLDNRFGVSPKLGSLDSVRQHMSKVERGQLSLLAAIKPNDAVFLMEPFTKEELETWVEENRFPLVPELSEATFPTLSESPKKLFVAMIRFSEDPNMLEKVRSQLFEFAKRIHPEHQFALLDVNQYDKFVESSLTVSLESELPVMGLLNFRDGTFQKQVRFPFGDDAALERFLADAVAGHVEVETMGGSALAGAWRTFKSFVRYMLDNPWMLGGAILVYLGILMAIIVMWRKMCNSSSTDDYDSEVKETGEQVVPSAVSEKILEKTEDDPSTSKSTDPPAPAKKAEKASDLKRD